MEKRPIDRRVLRTRQMLRDALFELIEERGYDALSIQDITERANIGRATFYVHYVDKEQLLLASAKDLLDDLHRHLQPQVASDVITKEDTLGVIVFQHVFEHAPVYRALLSERGAAVVVTLLRTDIAALVREMLIDPLVAAATVPLPADMLAEYCGAALWSLVNWWLRNGFPRPAEEMGHLLWQLVNQGLLKTLGLATEQVAEMRTE
jgi:AcrR family transcriptional regulator